MSLVGPGSAVVASPGCGVPSTLLRGLAQRSHEVPLTVYSGLQIDGYPFLDDADPDNFRFVTWHVNGRLRSLVGDGTVDYVPARASQVPHLLTHWGANVTVLRVSPADRHGFHSLGPTASYPLAAARTTPLVIAEIDPEVPRTFGNWIHRSQIAVSLDAETPMPEYPVAAPDHASATIARRVLELLPEQPVLQLGIGAIPEVLTSYLVGAGLGPLRFVGMATDAMVDLHESSDIDIAAVYPNPAILAAEVMGTRKVMQFIDQNPLVGVRDSAHSHHPAGLAGLDRFVSVNSAVAIDLSGQVNAESLGGRQISGIGGSSDYSETAFNSHGGLRILALPSTTADGRHSRIVASLGDNAAVTHSRSAVDIVVTEHGVADLRGRALTERRELLIAISEPAHRARLADPTPSNTEDTT